MCYIDVCHLNFRLTAGDGNTLFHYVNLDFTEGILLCPPVNREQVQSNRLQEILHHFRRSCQVIHDLLNNAVHFKVLYVMESGSPLCFTLNSFTAKLLYFNSALRAKWPCIDIPTLEFIFHKPILLYNLCWKWINISFSQNLHFRPCRFCDNSVICWREQNIFMILVIIPHGTKVTAAGSVWVCQ